MLKLLGLAALLAVIAVGSSQVALAQATAPGPVVTPQTLPQTGQMQSDAIKRETDDATKRANQASSDKTDAAKTMAPAGK